MSDQGAIGGDIYIIPSGGGPLRHLTTVGSAAWLEWLEHDDIGYTARWKGETIYTKSSNSGGNPEFKIAASMGDGQELMALSSARDGRGCLHPKLLRQSPGGLRRLHGRPNHPAAPGLQTHPGHPPQRRPQTHLGQERIDQLDQRQLQHPGLAPLPRRLRPIKKISDHHLHPRRPIKRNNSQLAPPRHSAALPFSALGYFVLHANPRGSYGQTEQFTQANVKDFGYGDLRDTLTGLDLLEKRLPIDKSREGITGWSYGGFMTMFAVTQTNRFHAAVAGAGISNWQSYYGQNSIDQWMVPFFGSTVYDDPAIYARSSPITYIKNVTTPTLIVVGDRDGECPAPQSFEFWHALRAEGVKTQLVIYPNEGHSFAIRYIGAMCWEEHYAGSRLRCQHPRNSP